MSSSLKKQFGRSIPDNIRILAGKIARKPTNYTVEWASSPEKSLSLYTNTRTINLFNSLNEMLIEHGWPFPAFMDLEEEKRLIVRDFSSNRLVLFSRFILGQASLFILLLFFSIDNPEKKTQLFDRIMLHYFRKRSMKVFARWRVHSLLRLKISHIQDIEKTYKKKLWIACNCTILPILDYVARDCMKTDSLNSMQFLVDAFFASKLRTHDLKPGYSIWDGRIDPLKGNAFATSLEKDLRLPGIYLASFFEFAQIYFAWYSSNKNTEPTRLNRHAIIHGAADYGDEINVTKLLMFLDLMLRVGPFLRVIMRGQPAADEI